MISLIVTVAVLAYTLLDQLVFQPDLRRGKSQSIFNLTDFNRPKDSLGRAPQSIFTKLTGTNAFGEWWDKAAIYAGHKNEVLEGYCDKNEDFNADSIFELYAFFIYWHGGAVANDIVFGRIINPMFNLGLKTVDNEFTSHRFTSPSRRFFWLYDDYLKLQAIANAPNGKYNLTVYTNKRKDAHNIDSKNVAIALLQVLQNYPFICGYFIDGLSNPTDILNRELYVLTDLNPPVAQPPKTNIPTPSKPAKPAIPISTPKTKTVSIAKTIGEKILIGLIVTIILSLIIKYFKRK